MERMQSLCLPAEKGGSLLFPFQYRKFSGPANPSGITQSITQRQMLLLLSEYNLDSRLRNMPEYLAWVIIPRERKNKYFVHQVMAHKVAAWGATFQLPLTVAFLSELHVFWKRDRILFFQLTQSVFLSSFLSFFISFSFFLYFLSFFFPSLPSFHSFFPFLPFFSPPLQAMKNHWSENCWEEHFVPIDSIHRRHASYFTRLYQNISTVAEHFPSINCFSVSLLLGYSFRRSSYKSAADTKFRLLPIRNYDLSGDIFQQEILGHRKTKK